MLTPMRMVTATKRMLTAMRMVTAAKRMLTPMRKVTAMNMGRAIPAVSCCAWEPEASLRRPECSCRSAESWSCWFSWPLT
ncbi:hypothetical protein D3C81_2095400 [compost metagenome]